jgi:hypothetical protein
MAAVLAVTTPRQAMALGCRVNSRLLAFATGEAEGLDPAAARREIVSAAQHAVDSGIARGPGETALARDESQPEQTLIALLEAVHRAGESPAGTCIPVFAGPSGSPSGGALILGASSR